VRDMELHQPDEHTNSLAERYCYYSMRAMLSLYMVEELGFSRQTAIAIFSYFSACVYFSPVLGGFVADTYLGKFSTILYFSVVYIAGIIFLTVTSIDALPWGMFTGLGLIALGSGGIKPCVAAFGAEQYARGEFSARDRTNRGKTARWFAESKGQISNMHQRLFGHFGSLESLWSKPYD